MSNAPRIKKRARGNGAGRPSVEVPSVATAEMTRAMRVCEDLFQSPASFQQQATVTQATLRLEAEGFSHDKIRALISRVGCFYAYCADEEDKLRAAGHVAGGGAEVVAFSPILLIACANARCTLPQGLDRGEVVTAMHGLQKALEEKDKAPIIRPVADYGGPRDPDPK